MIHAESGLGGPFGRMADSLVVQMASRNLRADLANLKDMFEAGQLDG